MNLPLSYSEIEETNEPKNKTRTTKISRNKTIKKRNFLNSLKNIIKMKKNDDDDDEDELEDFRPMENMENSKPENSDYQSTKNLNNDDDDDEDDDADLNQESFNNIDPNEVTANSYYSEIGNNENNAYATSYVPYYTELNNSKQVHTSEDTLMKKLNYMIHLLEEQQDQKTENVTEELVLYTFLGVFVIFVVDSFARAGKYTR